jgi:hypothetical protein
LSKNPGNFGSRKIGSSKEQQTVMKNLVLKSIFYPIIIAFCLAPTPGNRPDIFSHPHVYNIDDEIDNLKIELRMIKTVAKQKHCPKEINYEIITDKSHTMHLLH